MIDREHSVRFAATEVRLQFNDGIAAPFEHLYGYTVTIDDLPANLDLMVRRLERSGFTVFSASEGPEALDMLSDGERIDMPDLLMEIRATFDDNSALSETELLDEMSEPDLLVLDDLGAGTATSIQRFDSQTGRFEVYVTPFPDAHRRWPVSTEGACQPRWSRGGRELLYVSGDRLMALDLESDQLRVLHELEPGWSISMTNDSL